MASTLRELVRGARVVDLTYALSPAVPLYPIYDPVRVAERFEWARDGFFVRSWSFDEHGDDEAKLRGYWERLSEGGTVTMPFEKAPWGATFGMFVDRFGTSWMVNVADEPT